MAISFQGGKLFKKTSTGAIEFWYCISAAAFIITKYGQVDGKVQEAREEIRAGKNIGKANETSAEQQAYREAAARFTKKLKSGYVKTIEAASAGKVDAVIEGGISPMLAHRFDEQGHKIVYPAFVQPKIDGHRCIAVVKNGRATLWSRTRKPITGLPHIVQDIEAFAVKFGTSNFMLDGELYNHAYRDRFEELTSFIRQEKPKPGRKAVQYHIYDFPASDLLQFERLPILEALRTKAPDSSLIPVETVSVADEDELMLAFERFLQQGYEGAIVRNTFGRYVNKRSYDLQKVKEFQDSEFACVGVEEGRGKLAGHAIFVCAMDKANPAICFRAKMKGSTEELKKYFEHPELAIGKQLTVKYQGLTNKNGVPRFPVALRFLEEV